MPPKVVKDKKKTVRIGNWYKADDEKVHFTRKRVSHHI